MTFNQLDSLLSFIFFQSVSLVNMFFIISDDSVNLSDFIFSTVEVSSILEQVNHRDTYYVIWNANTKNDFVSWWNQNSVVKKIKKSDSKCSQSN